MRKIATVIVDDEPLARKRILDLLAKEKDVTVVAECADGFQALEIIHSNSPDLIFLDVQMPEKSGFEVVAGIRSKRKPMIIFVTAYDQHATKAFEINALDYLLKPFDDDRFTEALERARIQIRNSQNEDFDKKLRQLLDSQRPNLHAESDPSPRTLHRFIIKERGEALLVKADEVDYIESEGVYVRLHTRNMSYLLRQSLSDLESKLDPRQFFRIHRSTIVNLERIKKLVPHFHGDYIVVLQNDTHLKLSRSRRERLQTVLGAAF